MLTRIFMWALRNSIKFLSTSQLETLIYKSVVWRVTTLSPQDALGFLFRLDAAFYKLQGQQAVAYGGGVHTKHRHIRYHDFFVQRVCSGARVLDIGCGIGAVAYDLANQAEASVFGMDLSPKNIAFAQERHAHPNIEYRVGNVLTDLPGQNFDVVILSNVLEHLPDRPEFLRRVQAQAQATRFLIRVPLFEREWRVPLKKELGVEWRLDLTHETEYTLESFAQEMSEAGLEPVFQEVRWSEIWAELKPNVTGS